jgi:hypothetical protein
VYASISAALTLGLAVPSARAQDTTRVQDSTRTTSATSQRRIRIRKESGGEVVGHRLTARERADSIARADSVARADSLTRMQQAQQDSVNRIEQMRQDSLATIEKARQDSIAAIEKAHQDSLAAIEKARNDSTAQADSLRQAEQLRKQSMSNRYLFGSSGFYIGVSGGGGIPTGDFKDLGYDNGWGVNVPIGWHKPGNLLGLQLDLGYNQFNGTNFAGVGTTPLTLTNPDPKIWSANLNLTLNFPLTQSKAANFYLIGGGGVYRFRNFGVNSALGGFLGNDVIDPNAEDNQTARTKWGLNGGAGLSYAIGPTAIFVESRFVNVFAKRSGDANDFSDFFGSRTSDVRWVPISVGLTFR